VKRPVLHITNGDSALKVMRKAGIGGEIVPWRDVLHEGPVPAGLGLEELSAIRARFIADSGWAPFDEVLKGFRERDAQLAAFREHDEVILWFEHDLYDQLHMLQILAYLSGQSPGNTKLSLICVDEYLGPMSPQRMAELPAAKQPITAAHLDLAKKAWAAFCAPDPIAWRALEREDTSALPFLAGAILRHLEQFPSVKTGLNRTETQLLKAVLSGTHAPVEIFNESQRAEERVFVGDTIFWGYMDVMLKSRPPLLVEQSAAPRRIEATANARKVVNGELDWLAINGIDKWLGGVHITAGNLWRWDPARQELQRPGA
jgi:hypothetical protein